MRIKTNNSRSISTDFDMPKKFRLLNNGIETPYLQTSKRSFRILGDIPEYLDIEEIIETPKPKKIVKPMTIKSQPMAVINPNDVLVLNQVAQDLELEQNVLNEKQKDLENKQLYLDIQNQNLLQNVEAVKQLETDNLQKIEENKNSLVNLAYEIGKTNELVNSDFTASVNLIEEHKQSANPHNITKSTIGLDKVNNTSDIDKPISKAVEIALEDKADKQDVEDIKTEIEVYKKKADRIDRGLANFTGGIGGNELPIGGLEGQVLAKKTDRTGEYEWIDVSDGTSDHNKLKNRDLDNQHPISAITGLQDNLTLLANEDITLKAQIDANAEYISSLQEDTTTIKNDLDDLGDQVAGIEEKIPETASSTNPLVDKAYLDSVILSLPEFKIEVVDALPETGEEKIIYLVPKDSEEPDVHDEYIWVNSSFELIGTTQVDLTGYVKNTDYATYTVGGVVRAGGGFFVDTNGLASCGIYSQTQYDNNIGNGYFISKGTLENIKKDIVERAVSEDGAELSGYVKDTDYPDNGGVSAGVVKIKSTNGLYVSSGTLHGNPISLSSYSTFSSYALICKGTVENIKNDLVKRAITTNDIELTDEEKAQAQSWLGVSSGLTIRRL